MSLDTSSKNFDEGAAEKFAASATEDRSADNDSDDNDDSTAMEVEPKAPMFPKGIMDTIALRSFRVPLKAHYMIGMIAVYFRLSILDTSFRLHATSLLSIDSYFACLW